MQRAPSPVVGFNNNVRYRARVFHIQTEDSGVLRPHIDTHLFADGGRIIKSLRTEYADRLGTPDLARVVRELMKAQHRAMFRALARGELDDLIEGLDPERTPAHGRMSPPAEPPSAEASSAQASPPPVPFTRSPSAPAPSSGTIAVSDADVSRVTRAPSPASLSEPAPTLGDSTPPQRPPESGRTVRGGRPALADLDPRGPSLFGVSRSQPESLDTAIRSYLDAPEPAAK